ncbi:MAG: ATP-binding protein [bacterium]
MKISTKITLILFLIILFFGLFLGIYIVNLANKELNAELEERAKALIDNLAFNSEYLVLVGDKESLAKLGSGILKQKDIIFCKILDMAGNPLLQAGKDQQGGVKKFVSPIFTQKKIEAEEEIMLGIAKIGKEEIGKVHLTVSLNSLNQKLNRIRAAIIITLFVILVIVFLAGSLLIRIVLDRPIHQLVMGTEKIAAGYLDYEIPIKSQDEMGNLANAFNKMTKELKSGREELEKYHSHLEELVSERTNEVERVNEQLQQEIIKHKQTGETLSQKLKEIEAINQEMDGFTYTVSHDLKEPLRGIETFSKFLLDDYWDKLDDEGKDYLRRISSGANRLKLFIDDLLSLSRISRIKNLYETFSSNDIINDVLKRLELMIKERDCKIKVDDNLPLVYGDKIKLKEIFYNLISNAIKHNDKKPNIEVFGEENERETIFSIKDNGIGIKEEDFIRVFEPFRRLHKRREDKGGTGIGLAIVKKVIDEHKGRIWVESKLNEGSIFYFSLPKKELGIGD